MPPLVVRRMTQYVHPREQPRSGSMRNIERSSVCGVRICERAGSRSSSALTTAGQEGDGIGERQRAAADDQRVPLVPVLEQDGDPGQIEHVEEAGDLQLVADGKSETGKAGDGVLRLVRADRDARLAPGLHVVGEERPLRRGVVVGVDLAIDGLEAERAHPDVIWAGVAERDAGGRLLAQRSLLVGEPGADGFEQRPAHRTRHSKVEDGDAPSRAARLRPRVRRVAHAADVSGAGRRAPGRARASAARAVTAGRRRGGRAGGSRRRRAPPRVAHLRELGDTIRNSSCQRRWHGELRIVSPDPAGGFGRSGADRGAEAAIVAVEWPEAMLRAAQLGYAPRPPAEPEPGRGLWHIRGAAGAGALPLALRVSPMGDPPALLLLLSDGLGDGIELARVLMTGDVVGPQLFLQDGVGWLLAGSVRADPLRRTVGLHRALLARGEAQLHNAHGLEDYAAGELDAARREFGRSIAADPSYVDGLYNAAAAAALTDRVEEAVGLLARAAAVDPARVQVLGRNDEDFKSLRRRPDVRALLGLRRPPPEG